MTSVGESHSKLSLRLSAAAAEVFLKACSTLDRADWEPDSRLLASIVPQDKEVIARLAGRQGVRGLIARNLSWAKAHGWTPSATGDELEAFRGQRLVLQLRRRRDVVELAQALSAANIDFIMLKGFVLAEEVYGDLSARVFGDCDILVRPEAIERAVSVLAALGYRSRSDQPIVALMQAGEHAVSMDAPDKIPVDLHWCLADLVPMERNALVWEDSEPAGPGALGGRRLSPEMTVLHLAAHFAHHDFQELKPLIDFYVTADRLAGRIQAPRVRELAATLGLDAALDLTISMCTRYFRPRATVARLAPDRSSLRLRAALAMLGRHALLPLDRKPLDRWRDAARRRLITHSPAEFLAWLLPWLLPTPGMLAQRFAQPYRLRLYPRYYVVQIYRVVTRSRRLFIDLR